MVVLLARWLGIFCPIYFLGGDVRPALLSTMNLSQVSEFALVIGGIGYKQGYPPQNGDVEKNLGLKVDTFRHRAVKKQKCLFVSYHK